MQALASRHPSFLGKEGAFASGDTYWPAKDVTIVKNMGHCERRPPPPLYLSHSLSVVPHNPPHLLICVFPSFSRGSLLSATFRAGYIQVIARVRELVAGIWEEAKVEMYGSCYTGACACHRWYHMASFGTAPWRPTSYGCLGSFL